MLEEASRNHLIILSTHSKVSYSKVLSAVSQWCSGNSTISLFFFYKRSKWNCLYFYLQLLLFVLPLNNTEKPLHLSFIPTNHAFIHPNKAHLAQAEQLATLSLSGSLIISVGSLFNLLLTLHSPTVLESPVHSTPNVVSPVLNREELSWAYENCQ